MGNAMTERDGTTMEADEITYEERTCVLEATGDPKFFAGRQVLVGEQLEYDTCRKRGVVDDALTNFQQGSTTWFLRGDVAKDSLNNRIFAGHGDITSCDLPIPHYHFMRAEIKWVSNTVLVARPVVLYIQDVPVLWLPFIFQDLRPGRHSGLLIPQFGFSDIIRPSSQLLPADLRTWGTTGRPTTTWTSPAGSTGSRGASCLGARRTTAGSTGS